MENSLLTRDNELNTISTSVIWFFCYKKFKYFIMDVEIDFNGLILYFNDCETGLFEEKFHNEKMLYRMSII